MLLKKLNTKNFRSLEDFELEFSQDITLIIGPNNAGKSNVVDALLFVSQGMNCRVLDLLNQRNGFEKIVSRHITSHDVLIKLTFHHPTDGPGSYSLTFSKDGIVQEHTTIAGQDYRTNLQSGQLRHSYVGSVTDRLHSTFLNSYGVAPKLEELREFFKSVVHVNPFREPSYQFQIDPKPMVDSKGTDLARVIHYHYNNDRRRFDAYEDMVRKVVPEVEMIETPISSGPQATVSLTFTGDSEKYNLWQISSGLKDILVLLATIHFSPNSTLIVIEEPENHLHPAAQKALSAVIKETAARDKKQFILTTHSETIVGQFESLKAVFINREGSRSHAIPLPKAEVYQIWDRMGVERAVLFQLLSRTPQTIVIFEGRDDLKTLNPLWEYSKLTDRVIPARSEGGGWKEIVESAKALNHSLVRFRLPTRVFVLLDNDGHRDEKLAYLKKHGFDDSVCHVWSEKELESYLIIPSALCAISAKSPEEVSKVIKECGGRGKERFERILDALGIGGTPKDVVLTNALRSKPDEIPAELWEVPEKIKTMFAIRNA